MVSADSDRVPRAPPYSGTRFESRSLSSTWLSHSMAPLSRELRLTTGLVTLLLRTLQPPSHPKVERVWAVPISLATTLGITVVFFSSRYWDGSLPWVRSYPIMDSSGRRTVLPYGVSPFGHPRINACLRLPEAYRSLPRPSSPASAKASTMRP